MNKYTAAIITLGCRVNQYESDSIMQELKRNGFKICSSDEICDAYIINTCSVTFESDRKSRQIIRRCIAKNPNAKIIVTGCYAQINPEKVLKMQGVSFVCGNNGKSTIAGKLISLLNGNNEPSIYIPPIVGAEFDVMRVGAPLTRTRAFVKIQDGCESKCAYCIIPYARGSVRSNSPENIIDEVKNIASEGCSEVVLTGIETAAYGKDFKNGYTLADLLVEINKIEGIKRIRLGSLDPSAITREFVDKIKVLDKVMPHFHISMQSGCTKTLNLMRRKYNIDMAKRSIDYLRSAWDSVMLSCDIITGFPSESDTDFNETLEFFKREKFLHLHIFPYSRREGTPAATMPNQVEECVKKQRLHALSQLEKEQKPIIIGEYIKKNPVVEVLVESISEGYAYGHTPSFVEVKMTNKNCHSGQMVKARLICCDGEYAIGEIT